MKIHLKLSKKGFGDGYGDSRSCCEKAFYGRMLKADQICVDENRVLNFKVQNHGS
ncbi:MAG TPA: hypothetical protein PLJ14_03820 [Accumulibacter sp.]|nr:hypothetical protein [Accumulibacter sp.]